VVEREVQRPREYSNSRKSDLQADEGDMAEYRVV